VQPTCTSYGDLEYSWSPFSACGLPYSNARSNVAGPPAPHETSEKNSAPRAEGTAMGKGRCGSQPLSHDLNRWLQLLRSETAHPQEIEEEEIEPYLLSFFVLALKVDCFCAYSCSSLRGGLHLVSMAMLRNCKIL
jgi:hypothetical protein